MTKKIGGKPVKGVKSTEETKEIAGTEEVSGVGGVKATTGVGRVHGAGSVRGGRLTRVISMAEREQLFKLINEEAEKLVSQGAIPERRRAVVETAVKMALDAAIVDDGDSDGSDKNKPLDKKPEDEE